MILRAHDLRTTLSQEITITEDAQLYAIRPHILKVGSPTGTLTIRLETSAGVLMSESETVDIADIPDDDGEHAHGMLRFLHSPQVRAGDVIRVKLVPGGGYAFATDAYIAWCTDWQTRRPAAAYGYSPNDGIYAPLELEIWALKHVARRAG